MFLVLQKNKNDIWKKYFSMKYKTYQQAAVPIHRAMQANEFVAMYFEDGKMAGYIETWKLFRMVGTLLEGKYPYLDLESPLTQIVHNSNYNLDDSEKERRSNQAAKMRAAKTSLAESRELSPVDKVIEDVVYTNKDLPNPYV